MPPVSPPPPSPRTDSPRAELAERLTRIAEEAARRVEPSGDAPRRGAGPLRVVEVHESETHVGDVGAEGYDGDVVVIAPSPSRVARFSHMARGALAVLDTDGTFPSLSRAMTVLAQRVTSGREALRLLDLRTRASAMRKMLRDARRIARSDASVLLVGATGAGKEYIARALHESSTRAREPFVVINCGALPESLLESQLFGHERGAFTGADRRHSGFFEAASGGTLLLDEIGELPQHLQVKLLTVLESHEVTRLGSTKPVAVDVRVLAATNRDVDEEVRAGRFRSDLLYRLDVVRIRVPSLAERREDVPELAGRFVYEYTRENDVPFGGIEPDAIDRIVAHDWPGNVRELHNALERALLMAAGSRITTAHLPSSLAEGGGASSDDGPTSPSGVDVDAAVQAGRTLREVRDDAVAEVERSFLTRLLERTGGKIAETAELAGLRPRSLYDKMKQHGLRKEDFRSQG